MEMSESGMNINGASSLHDCSQIVVCIVLDGLKQVHCESDFKREIPIITNHNNQRQQQLDNAWRSILHTRMNPFVRNAAADYCQHKD